MSEVGGFCEEADAKSGRLSKTSHSNIIILKVPQLVI